MSNSSLSRSGALAYVREHGPTPLCLETQSREIMAILVHDVVADAMRLGLYDKPAERVEIANGAPVGGARQDRNG